MVDSLNTPLREGFYCDSKACLPVTINYLSALALEQGIVGTMPFADCTAMATPLASVVGVNNFKSNVLVEAPAFEQAPERIEGYSHDFFVESLSFRGKAFKVFNGNVGIKSESYVSNVPDYFTKPIVNKIVFSCLEFSEASGCPTASLVSEGLEFFFSLKNLFAFNPNIFSEICLFEDFPDWRENGDSVALGVDINAENIFSLWQFGFFFGEVSNNLKFASQSVGLTIPSFFKEGSVSLVVPVLFDWNRQSLFGVHSESHKESVFCFKDFAVVWNIEFNSNTSEKISLDFNDISLNVTDNLRIEGGAFLAC